MEAEPGGDRRPDWFSRNGRWAMPVFGVLGLLAVGAFIAAVMAFVLGTMKQSDPYQRGMEIARADERVQSLLGSPIAEGWLITGSITLDDDTGEAEMTIPVTGPRGSGILQVYGEKEAGQWSLLHLVLLAEGGSIDLLVRAEGKPAPADLGKSESPVAKQDVPDVER